MHNFIKKYYLCILTILFIFNMAHANINKTAEYYKTNEIDFNLYQVTSLISEGKIEKGLELLENILKKYPNFELAKNIYKNIGSSYYNNQSENYNEANYIQAVLKIKSELKARFNFLENEQLFDKFPEDIVYIDYSYRYVILVDVAKHRFYLLENIFGFPKIVKTYYSTIGENGFPKMIEGDKKTPLGVYFIDKYIQASALNYKTYGRQGGLSIDYPNKIDKLENKTGYGIWIHGSPIDVFSRPPESSRGCVSIEDHNLLELKKIINKYKVPVIINKNLTWINKKTWIEKREQLFTRHQLWNFTRKNDLHQYFSYFHEEFLYKNNKKLYDYVQELFNKQKTYFNTKLDNLMILKDKSRDLMVSIFDVNQQINDKKKSNVQEMRMYWKKNKSKQYLIYTMNVNPLYKLHIKSEGLKLKLVSRD